MTSEQSELDGKWSDDTYGCPLDTGDVRRALRGTFWRLLLFQSSLNFERMQALAYVFAYSPLLRRRYKRGEQMARALTVHLETFNTNPLAAALIMGVNARMDVSQGGDPLVLSSKIKATLMSPLAGVADRLIWFTWLPICMLIGASIVIQGSFLGSILAVAMFGISFVVLKYFALRLGYSKGLAFVTDEEFRWSVRRAGKMASIIGLVLSGGLITETVNLSTPLHASIEHTVSVQHFLDRFPGILPFTITLCCAYLTRRQIKRSAIITGLVVIVFFGKWLRIL